jgi:gamma-glutamyl-gamma-aminobutyraldehyde dehydrogenase
MPGNPLDPTVAMGAIIDQIQLDRVLDYINVGVQEATLLMGGRRMHASTGGYYVEPTIFESSTGKTRIAREEIFGPVLTVLTFDTLDEAIELANDSDYGLGAAIWTSNLTIAHDAARRLRAGTVWVNCYEETNDMNFPFGGFKQSGNGRDNSIHALEKYTELKSTIIRLR